MIKIISVYARSMELSIDYHSYDSVDEVVEWLGLDHEQKYDLISGKTLNIVEDELFAIRLLEQE